jgi:hypothetical protein
MTPNSQQLKTYLASFCAVQMLPGIVITDATERAVTSQPSACKQGGAVFSCEVDWESNPDGKFAAAFGHHARFLVRYEEAEAREYVLSEAHRFLPEEDGWTGHNVTLTEIPRARFVEVRVFITAREIWDRILRLTGFRST